MDIFMPPDSCNVGATRLWLIAVMVAMSLAGLALLALAVLLWWREARLRVAWWGRLPLALPVAWAGVCGFVAVQAFTYYGAERDLPACPPPRRICIYNGPDCLVLPPLGGEAQLILIIAVSMLILGWLALSRLARLASRTTA
jgi:hypothetical protein